MTKQEIEQAIENGKSVWYIVNNELAKIDLSCNFHKIEDSELLTWYDKYSDYYTHRKKLEDLYKSQAEAEHYLHHANITRIEELPFLTWEEFLKEKRFEFIDDFGKRYSLRIYGNKILLEEVDFSSIYESDGWVLMEDLTEANFYKAYDECVRLFKE